MVIANEKNMGFCQAHNQAIRASKGTYYLALNPDVILMPDFLFQMKKAIELSNSIDRYLESYIVFQTFPR